MPGKNMISRIYQFLIVSVILLGVGCASLTDLAKRGGIQKPAFQLTDSRITKLSFKGVDLVFDVQIENPNSLGISLSGFQYDFLINQRQLVNGRSDEELKIPARGKETVRIPVSLLFSQIYQLYSSLRNRDSVDYQMNTCFLVNLPVLGQMTIPLKKSGKIPLLKIPSINLKRISLKKLSFTGADLEIQLEIDNPNQLSFDLKKLDYALDVNQTNWLRGVRNEALKLSANGEQVVSLPVHLNLLKLGSTVYQILSENQPLKYEFSGKVDLSTSLSLMKSAQIPFDKKGKIKITR